MKLKMYNIILKPNKNKNKTLIWKRFATNKKNAQELAIKTIDCEYYGEGELISVKST